MELKRGWEVINGQTAQSSNRTFMELKQGLVNLEELEGFKF